MLSLGPPQFEGFRQDLRAVIHGNNTLGVYITLRMRLRCEILRNGKTMPGKLFDVLNEVVVDRGSNPYLSKIECYEHNHLITKVRFRKSWKIVSLHLFAWLLFMLLL
jgi:NAD+ kinase